MDGRQMALFVFIALLVFVLLMTAMCAVSDNALKVTLELCAISANVFTDAHKVTLELFAVSAKVTLELGKLISDTTKAILVEGFGGGILTILESIKIGVVAVYNDLSMNKLVLLAAVAVMVKQFPWMMDSIVRMLSKPPR